MFLKTHHQHIKLNTTIEKNIKGREFTNPISSLGRTGKQKGRKVGLNLKTITDLFVAETSSK